MRRVMPAALALLAMAGGHVAAEDRRDADEITRRLAAGIIPQPARAADLYRRARPFVGSAFEGMVLCEVRVTGESWDGSDPIGPVRRYMGRPDIDVAVRMPSNAVRFEGPEDQARVVFAVAGARLSSGDPFTLVIEDRDVVSNDAIATVTFRFEGRFPIRYAEGPTSVECRGTSSDGLAAAVTEAVEAADRALAALPPAATPSVDVVHFRDTEKEEAGARLAVYDLVRLVGPRDPRVTERLATIDRRAREWTTAAGRLVSDLDGRAPGRNETVPVVGSPFRVTVDDIVCDVGRIFDLQRLVGVDAELQCVIRATVAHDDPTPQAPSFMSHVIEGDGTTSAAPIVLLDADSPAPRRPARGTRLPAGRHAVLLAVPCRNPVLLRLGTRTGVTWIRLAATTAPTRVRTNR